MRILRSGTEADDTGSGIIGDRFTSDLSPVSLFPTNTMKAANGISVPLAAPTVIEIETYPILPHFIVAIIGSSS